jgi:hypothetical protein|tara:strand:+ start:3076 stop:3657 length:582 start_codon:yes stop_codon:yes gene_type:complete
MKPLSKSFLLSQGVCCYNGCRNCPYTEEKKKMNGLNLDPTEIEVLERTERKLLPKGRYTCKLVDAVDEPGNVSKTGATYSRIKLVFQVLQGDYKDERVTKYVLYDHSERHNDEKKAMAVSIGVTFLAKFHDAAKCDGNITPPSLKTGKPVDVDISVRKGGVKDNASGERYPDENDIDKFISLTRETSTSESPF